MKRLEIAPFRTAVWNMYTHTPIERSEPVLEESMAWGVSLWFVNEARGAHRTEMFRSRGLETVAHAQFRLAWDPQRWALEEEWAARLSEQRFFAADGKTPVWSQGQAARLRDLVADRSLEAWSYHTPAHVQKPGAEDAHQGSPNHPGYPFRRYLALVESMAYLADRAHETPADGFMAAGDDNWDEDGALDTGDGIQTADVVPILLGEATGLRQVQAGEGTFAQREIDDYRVLRPRLGGTVKPTGVVRVRDGGGAERPAHKIHEREWVHLVEPQPVAHACPRCQLEHMGVLLDR